MIAVFITAALTEKFKRSYHATQDNQSTAFCKLIVNSIKMIIKNTCGKFVVPVTLNKSAIISRDPFICYKEVFSNKVQTISYGCVVLKPPGKIKWI